MRHSENNTCTRIKDWYKEYKIAIIVSICILAIFGICAFCTSKQKVLFYAAGGLLLLFAIAFLLTFMMCMSCKQSYPQSVMKDKPDKHNILIALSIIAITVVLLGVFVWVADAARGLTTENEQQQEALSKAEKSYNLQSLQCEGPQTMIHPENTNDIHKGIMNCTATQNESMHNYRAEWTMTNDQDFTITDMYQQEGTSWMKMDNKENQQ